MNQYESTSSSGDFKNELFLDVKTEPLFIDNNDVKPTLEGAGGIDMFSEINN